MNSSEKMAFKATIMEANFQLNFLIFFPFYFKIPKINKKDKQFSSFDLLIIPC